MERVGARQPAWLTLWAFPACIPAAMALSAFPCAGNRPYRGPCSTSPRQNPNGRLPSSGPRKSHCRSPSAGRSRAPGRSCRLGCGNRRDPVTLDLGDDVDCAVTNFSRSASENRLLVFPVGISKNPPDDIEENRASPASMWLPWRRFTDGTVDTGSSSHVLEHRDDARIAPSSNDSR